MAGFRAEQRERPKARAETGREDERGIRMHPGGLL